MKIDKTNEELERDLLYFFRGKKLVKKIIERINKVCNMTPKQLRKTAIDMGKKLESKDNKSDDIYLLNGKGKYDPYQIDLFIGDNISPDIRNIFKKFYPMPQYWKKWDLEKRFDYFNEYDKKKFKDFQELDFKLFLNYYGANRIQDFILLPARRKLTKEQKEEQGCRILYM